MLTLEYVHTLRFHRFALFPVVAWRLNLEGNLHVVDHILQDLRPVISLILLSPPPTDLYVWYLG